MAYYDACVATSLSWFLGSTNSHSDGRARGVYYTWSYAIDDAKHVEDGAHAGLDLEGLYRAYLGNRYASVLSRAQMQAFANDVVDVMPESQGHWAGTVDGGGKAGHAAVTDYPRPNILLMLEFRPEAFPYFAKATLGAKRTVGDPTAISSFALGQIPDFPKRSALSVSRDDFEKGKMACIILHLLVYRLHGSIDRCLKRPLSPDSPGDHRAVGERTRSIPGRRQAVRYGS